MLGFVEAGYRLPGLVFASDFEYIVTYIRVIWISIDTVYYGYLPRWGKIAQQMEILINGFIIHCKTPETCTFFNSMVIDILACDQVLEVDRDWGGNCDGVQDEFLDRLI